jgi:ankyrin repeat protein
MSFITHLQSSLILGTKMTHPEEEHFHKQECQELFSYIRHHNNTKLKELILQGTDSDKCEQEHIRALSFAVLKNNYEATEILLNYGCDINHKDCFGKRALDYAHEINNHELVKLLQDNNAVCRTQELEISHKPANIMQAAIIGDLKALVYYHHLGTNLHQKIDNNTTLLHLAIEGNNEALLVYLLNKGINIDERDRSGTTPLILAAMEPARIKLLSRLIQRKATLDQRSKRHLSALTMAIKRHNIQAAILLVNSGANVNIRDGINTPLTLTHALLTQAFDTSFKKELRELETLLLVKNAHVNSSDDKLSWSPLMLTASQYQDHNHIKHLKLLIQLGANIDQIDKNERTALMIASSLGRVEAIELLLHHKASINIADKFGWTALMLSVYYNQKETVKLLLNGGADVNFSTKKELTALKVAIDNERESIISILKEYGAVSPKE